MERRNRLIIVFVIGTLLFTNIMMINKLNSLEKRIQQLYGNINAMSGNISSISGQMYNSNEKEKLVAQYNYNAENLDDNYDKAKVKVDVSFNKLDNNSKSYIMYKAIDVTDSNLEKAAGTSTEMLNNNVIDSADSKWEQTELKNTGALNYTADLDLSYKSNYAIQIMVQNDKTTLSEDLSPLDLASKLSERVDIRAMPTRADSTGNLTYEVIVENNYEGKEKMKMRSITSYVYYKNNLIGKTDIMQQGGPREIPSEVKTEAWDYQGKLKIEGVESGDFMKDIRIEVVAVDGYGKEYKNGFKQ